MDSTGSMDSGDERRSGRRSNQDAAQVTEDTGDKFR